MISKTYKEYKRKSVNVYTAKDIGIEPEKYTKEEMKIAKKNKEILIERSKRTWRLLDRGINPNEEIIMIRSCRFCKFANNFSEHFKKCDCNYPYIKERLKVVGDCDAFEKMVMLLKKW